MTRRGVLMFAVIFVITAGIDQGTKAWARTLAPGPHPVVAGYWDWEPAQNPGTAFSLVPGGSVVLALIAAGALVGIGIAVMRTSPAQRLRFVGLALIAGGALGNLIDRVRLGSVTDFVRWRIHEHLWPIFNVADGALLVGILLLLAQRTPRPRLAA